MHGTRRLTDAELAEIQRREPAIRASLACEGMYLAVDEERLNRQMDAERLPEEDRIARIIAFHRIKRESKAVKAAG